MQPAAAPRRLSARRGSTSAPDPFGTHAHLNRSVQSSSTLTIVRVTSPPPPPDAAPAPSSPRRIHRRLPPQPASSNGPEHNPRLSFAFSTFAPGSAPGGPATIPSPSTSPRLRPSSPRRLSGSLPSSVPRLSPEQLLDLAKSSTDPRHVPSPLHYSSSPSHSPQLRAQSPLGAHSHPSQPTFTPLPDDIHLPFIDRPSEVAALISSPPSAKLFSLLAQTFPRSTALDATSASEPTKWSYAHLHEHLTQATRQESPDVLWVFQARKCILSHSELIWERVKGALGIPPDLDVDYDQSELDSNEYALSSSRSTSSIDTDELSDDHGRAARGHWDDWDAVMDSPIYDRRVQSGHTSPVLPLSLNKQLEERLHSVHLELRDPNEGGDVTISPTPIRSGSGTSSPPQPVGYHTPSSYLSIEPLLAPSSLVPTHSSTFAPTSIGTHASLATSEIVGLGLDDIQEGAEEEEELTTVTSSPTEQRAPENDVAQAEEHDPDLISPSQIQGLRISTAPIPNPDVSSSFLPAPSLPVHPSIATAPSSTSLATSTSTSTTYIAPSPISPLPPYPYPNPQPIPSTGTRSRPVSGSFFRPPIGYTPSSVFSRSGSSGSLGSLRGDHRHHDDTDESSSESGHAVGDRGPGSPLFPTNFARLDTQPTLSGHWHAQHGVGAGLKKRAHSHGAAAGGGGSVAGYKRLSWGAMPTSSVSGGA